MKSREIKKFRKEYKTYSGPDGADGLHLAVLYDEKDDVKKYGAKWNPAPEGEEGGHWSMPANRLTNEALPDQTTVREWLDDHQMIVGPQGALDATTTAAYIETAGYTPTEYNIRRPGDDVVSTFAFYAEADIVSFSDGNGTSWLTGAEGRNLWKFQMEDEYRLIEGVTPDEETL